MEKWKKIKSHPNYKVSNTGKIMRVDTGHIQKQHKVWTGYIQARLWDKNKETKKYTHRLVMEAFVGPSKLDVNHKNLVKHDNRLENLEYMTRSQNCLHGIKNGSNKTEGYRRHYESISGEGNKNNKLTTAQVKKIAASKIPNNVLAKKYAVSSATVWKIKHGVIWKHITVKGVKHESQPKSK